MEYKFNVRAMASDKLIHKKFNSYFENRTEENLVSLLRSCLAYVLFSSPLKSIKFVITDLNDDYLSGKYCDGTIYLNAKMLVNASNELIIPKVLYTLFHEFCHAVVSFRNLKIMETRTSPELFMPQFDNRMIYNVIFSVTKNELLSEAVVNYFYLNNKNEYNAYTKGAIMAKEFLARFVPEKNFFVPSGEQLIDREKNNLYKAYPFLKGKEEKLPCLIERFQFMLLDKGIENLSMDEKILFCSSTFVSLSQNTKNKLVEECCRSKDIVASVGLICNPLIILTEEDVLALSTIYGKESVEEFTYRHSKTK